MRVLLTVLLAVSSVNAYDAVLFSNEQKITEDFPSVENILSTASADAPVVFIVNPDFTLGQFSREAHAYSAKKEVKGLPAVVKSATYYASRYLRNPVYAPDAVTVTSMDDFISGNEVYIIAGEDWTSMEALTKDVFLELGKNNTNYTAVITATEAVSTNKTREKRVATSEMDSDSPLAAGPDMDMPMVLPPYNRSQYPDVKPGVPALGSCLLYLEGVNIVVQNSKKVFATIPVRSLTNTTSWSYADGDVKCNNATNGTYTFAVRLKLKGDVFDSAQRVKINSGTQLMFT
ncbi:hypothetical protein OESDEN_09361 [Oesophagostomum dentatum]|uniref:Uncharacterized protein n=1 Tax=Oesophagostomum dentatum TaxID=61180 RepID=A0A0B1T3R4_OESDE|nr:hypothetical protein OESDEN_09361 [Oesophagostomum dentatum]